MRIGFDIRPALSRNARRRGIGRYTLELAQSLLESQTGHEFVLFSCSDPPEAFPRGEETLEIPRIRRPSRVNWMLDRFQLGRYVRKARLDVFHATEITATPWTASTCVIATVHDLIPLIFWEQSRNHMPWDYRWGLRSAWKRVREADLIITDSACSRNDICQHLEVPEEKVAVVYPGCSERLAPIPPDQARGVLRKQYCLEEPFLLYVGGSDFRKNLPFLIRGFRQIRETGYRGKLLMIGETFETRIPEIEAVRELVRELDLAASVTFLGYVSDPDLSCFYSACDFVTFPSLYEGFGFPVLEAMKCGAVVLASRASSIPEVAGEIPYFFDPRSEESLVEAFREAVRQPDAAESRREAGRERAARFTWRRAASEVLSLYRGFE